MHVHSGEAKHQSVSWSRLLFFNSERKKKKQRKKSHFFFPLPIPFPAAGFYCLAKVTSNYSYCFFVFFFAFLQM